ncbi:MAG: RsmG family class I SAM-dependent methyltransferase [Actinomycetota bacterium]
MNSDWLIRALEESRARGFLGPNAYEPHITHALGFAESWSAVRDSPPESFVDLGSGGGLPGLVLLEHWGVRGLLLDAMTKRTALLSEVLLWEGAPSTGEVFTGRAEEVARLPQFSETFELVTARSFGPPGMTAECAVRFLKVGGILLVSEPPDADSLQRWPDAGLGTLGLRAIAQRWDGAGYQIIEKFKETASIYPRKNGVPGKTPIF